jgi:hypothetical protein
MPSPEPRSLPGSFYEKSRELRIEAEQCADPDVKKVMLEAIDRYYKADIELGLVKEGHERSIQIMASAEDDPKRTPSNDSDQTTSAFYRFLEQALTFGAKGIKKSALPRFIGFLAYLALIGLLAGSILLNRPQVTAAAIVLLMLAGVMSILLLFEVPKKVRPIIFEIILLLVVMVFLAVSAYAVFTLLNDKPTGASQQVFVPSYVPSGSSSSSTAPKIEPPDLESTPFQARIRADGLPAFEGQITFSADLKFKAPGEFLVSTGATGEHIECPGGVKGEWAYANDDHTVLNFQMEISMIAETPKISHDQYLQCLGVLQPLTVRKTSSTCTFRSSNECHSDDLNIHLLQSP